VFFQAESYYIFAFGCSHQQTTLTTTLVTPTPFLLTANSEGCNLLYSLRGSLVLLGRPDIECWNLWSQDKEQPAMDEAEDNSAAVRSHYHHPEEASSQERRFLSQEVLHQADS
jgi:hypothetical protein